jgi:GH25 family lysozyme M1 (1,4-beta-N-acetylmuramidase)
MNGISFLVVIKAKIEGMTYNALNLNDLIFSAFNSSSKATYYH